MPILEGSRHREKPPAHAVTPVEQQHLDAVRRIGNSADGPSDSHFQLQLLGNLKFPIFLIIMKTDKMTK